MSGIIERSYRLETTTSAVFVLDPPEAGTPPTESREYRSRVVETLRALSQSAATVASSQVMSLGSKRNTSVEDFLGGSSEWFDSNKGRLSVLSPVFEELAESNARIIVLGRREPFDIRDWIGTEQLSRAIFRVGAQNIDADTISRLIVSTPARVEVGSEVGSEGMIIPITWNNPAYWMSESLRLVAEDVSDYRVEMTFSGRSDVDVIARARDTEGKNSTLHLTEVYSGLPDNGWHQLPACEAAVVAECIDFGSYSCPFGQHTHSSEDLECTPPSEIIGRSVLETISSRAKRQFVLLRRSADGFEFQLQSCDAVRTAPQDVLARREDSVMLLKFDLAAGRWFSESFNFQQFYRPEGSDTYVVLM